MLAGDLLRECQQLDSPPGGRVQPNCLRGMVEFRALLVGESDTEDVSAPVGGFFLWSCHIYIMATKTPKVKPELFWIYFSLHLDVWPH